MLMKILQIETKWFTSIIIINVISRFLYYFPDTSNNLSSAFKDTMHMRSSQASKSLLVRLANGTTIESLLQYCNSQGKVEHYFTYFQKVRDPLFCFYFCGILRRVITICLMLSRIYTTLRLSSLRVEKERCIVIMSGELLFEEMKWMGRGVAGTTTDCYSNSYCMTERLSIDLKLCAFRK